MKRNLLTLITLTICFIGFAQTFTVNNIEYDVLCCSNNEVKITANTNTGDIVIPTQVVNNGRAYKVTIIGDDAFKNNQLTSVTIPTSIISIGNSAFSNNELTNVTIPNSVTYIGVSAFDNNKLTNVIISNSLTIIRESAFRDNELTNVIIPNGVTDIRHNAFRNNKLTSVTIPNSVINIRKRVFKDNKLINVTIPNSVTTIGESAFENNALTSVIIGNGVTTIGKSAFQINELTNVIIPNGVTDIEDSVFKRNQLISVTIPNTIKTIGNESFADNQLQVLTIPNSVTTIGESAFFKNQLINVSIPNSVISIGNQSFRDNRLTDIIIPNSVTTIGNIVFYNNQLTSVIIPNSVTSIGGAAFELNQLTDITIPNSVTTIGVSAFARNQLANITIPNSVTTIGIAAFRDNKLTDITIPNSITTIGNRAFELNQLTSVTIGNSITNIEEDVFANNKLTSVTIPNSVTAIGERAFHNNLLERVTIPEGITSIGRGAFSFNPISNFTTKAKTPPVITNNILIDVFSNRSSINLEIPAGTTTAYITAGWTGFKSLTEFTIWSGSNGTGWTDTGNWNENLIASTSQNVVIPNVVNFPVISSGVTAEMNDLSIEEFSSFSIEDNGAAIVNGDLNSAETITINSSATTSGTFIVKGTANGTVSFEKSGLLANEWNLITVPVSGQSIKDFVENTANEIRVNTTVTPNRYAVAYYDDSKAEGSKWVYYTTDDLASNIISFEKGRSYIISRATDGSIGFSGSLETNDVIVNVNADQWNAIGSPYTAYLPINANSNNNFIQENLSKLDPLYQSVYTWDANQNKYVTTSLLDTDTSLNVGQGFMVKTNTGVSSITFKESHRLANATGSTTFSRSRNHRSNIHVMATQDGVQVTTKINYISNTTKGLDAGYDIGNFKGASFDVFTHLVEGTENTDFTIQSLPDSDYETMVIPIGLQSEAGQEISLSVQTDNIPANLTVYLEDSATRKFINLTKEKSYTFTTTSTLEGIGRFYLHTTSKVLHFEDRNALRQDVKILKSGKQEITIQGLASDKQVTVSLYSVLGNEVYKKVAVSQGMLTIEPNLLDTGVYIVKVESLQGTKTKKVIFK
ncbi:leucine-rich repeat domain-containing protein [Tenacibaculum agarivorans]|uniref:leucine-rich repeat domain-containing protein n=1 Tax=Tenacibaculum agarivorans TaxID=1908389 RepID=UPI00094BC5EB|nr:leucine-rich repeat domain-containing protein [Tenacibaculum agarivorans]